MENNLFFISKPYFTKTIRFIYDETELAEDFYLGFQEMGYAKLMMFDVENEDGYLYQLTPSETYDGLPPLFYIKHGKDGILYAMGIEEYEC